MIPDWITLSQTAGTGNATITVTASSYTELLSRSAALTVSTTSRSANVTVSQVFDSSFSVSPTRVTGIPSALTYNYLDILADTTWEVYSAPDWLSFNDITGSGNSRITMLATGNTGTTRNGTVYLRNSRGIERTVYVEQVGAGQSVDTISVSPVSAFFPSSGDSVAISVTSNSTWSVTLPAWLSASVVSGSGNSVVTITATANTAATQAGYVVFSTANDTAQVSVSQDGYYVAPSGSVTSTATTIDSTGSTESNGVTANVSWTAVTSAPWITVSPTSGINGYTSITISAAIYDSYNKREGWVYIRNQEDDTLLASIKVSQNGTNYNPYINDPLTFEMLESGTIVFKGWQFSSIDGVNAPELEYSKDGGSSWTSIPSILSGVSIPVSSGDIVQFKGDNQTMGTDSTWNTAHLTSSARHNIYGNLMSLISGSTVAPWCFRELFVYSTGLVSAAGLVFPNTTNDYCCYEMFSGCTSLTTAPYTLSASVLSTSCYEEMFWSCNALTTPPLLPATTLANNCYKWMFLGCVSLTTAPVLSATTLANSCYEGMFEDCSGLVTPPALPAAILANRCYASMFCYAGITTPPQLSATTLAPYCYESMLVGCPISVAPSLPATTLEDSCYYGMFTYCTNLLAAPVLPASTLVSNCYFEMFRDCPNLSYIKCLATNISGDIYTDNWVENVASGGTFVKASSASWTAGPDGIPSGWTVQDA